jgi:SAM-dependent methyltransferase
MTALSKLDSTDRFTGRAGAYAKYRPSYPSRALDHIVSRCELGADSLMVDVGCGTGISSRLFGALGIKVLGIEPNDDMRAVADAVPSGASGQRVAYRTGQAERTGLAAAVADAVLAAQAFHWFEPHAALHEFHRILKPGGWVILMWNERDDRDPFTLAYSGLVDQARDTAFEGSMSHERAGNVLLASPLFSEGQRVSFGNEQILDEDGLLGRAFSVSYAPTGAADAARWTDGLRKLFREHQQAGRVVIRYQTRVLLARRS